jgi:hypothetical protein
MEREMRGALIELVLSDEAPPDPPTRIDGVVVGTIAGIGEDGSPLVSYDAAPTPQRARSVVPIDEGHREFDVALMFEGGDPTRPIVMGLMYVPKRREAEATPTTPPDPTVATPVGTTAVHPTAERDGERLVLTAEREIVLRCGHSSITLTRAGKILIKGAYLSSRSSGVNRIQGGSVQIN